MTLVKTILCCAFVCLAVFITSCQKKETSEIAAEFAIEESSNLPPPSDSTNTTHTVEINVPPKEGLEIGDIAWELTLQDSNGVFVKLSSLRGKMVLLDFWASWCKPCKIQNKYLINVYSKYKDTLFANAKGFEVYMVSIDRRDAWLQSLRKEKYNWKYDLIDEGGAAQWRYGVKSIPSNFLLDNNGIIVAKNLRDSLVESTLIRFLK